MSSKSKKRVVLPSRPDPPSVEQILEDLGKATPNDPVFSVLQDAPQDRAADSVVESRYQQSQRYLELNERLQQAKGELATKRDELCLAGERLEQSVAETHGVRTCIS
ncbi:UPF0449 protein C19orf25 homolog isoform X2 [Amia ocellicauda]|uniref:UPF0449 protein C19orf25 homolog isoform X2 n=1 Tax=Amia ocellicauda TaxID=2972642 RepID=UPI003463B49B